uniref:Uncharacterized protein n=1 Tax=Nemalion sp. H.1444 TaxID=1907586 RepID=A0A1G4NWC8_9FLOR|nr:Hypothetical protein ORF_5 [Nemalion sp. H.1444]
MISFHHHVNFPKYWFHRIETSHKILSIVVYIFVLPFCSTNILFVHYIIIVLLLSSLFVRYPGSLYKFIVSLIPVLIIFIFIATLTASTNVGLSLVPIPYQLKYLCYELKANNTVTFIYNNYLYLSIPTIVLRSYLLANNYLSLYYIVTLTTSFEDLIVNVSKYNTDTKCKSTALERTILVILIASNLIPTFYTQIRNVLDAILLRGIRVENKLYSAHKLIYLICLFYCTYLSKVIKDITSSIFSRNLEYYDHKLWFIF